MLALLLLGKQTAFTSHKVFEMQHMIPLLSSMSDSVRCNLEKKEKKVKDKTFCTVKTEFPM